MFQVPLKNVSILHFDFLESLYFPLATGHRRLYADLSILILMLVNELMYQIFWRNITHVPKKFTFFVHESGHS